MRHVWLHLSISHVFSKESLSFLRNTATTSLCCCCSCCSTNSFGLTVLFPFPFPESSWASNSSQYLPVLYNSRYKSWGWFVSVNHCLSLYVWCMWCAWRQYIHIPNTQGRRRVRGERVMEQKLTLTPHTLWLVPYHSISRRGGEQVVMEAAAKSLLPAAWTLASDCERREEKCDREVRIGKEVCVDESL